MIVNFCSYLMYVEKKSFIKENVNLDVRGKRYEIKLNKKVLK